MTITVKYSCAECGLERVTADVPARDAGEDVIAWTEKTIGLVCRDHDRRSPGCRPKQLSEMLIPIEGADYIGGPALQ